MIKWLIYLLIAFLLIDHFWVHYGGPFLESMRGSYREELKKATQNWEQVQTQQLYKQSILDKILEKLRGLVKKEEGGKANE